MQKQGLFFKEFLIKKKIKTAIAAQKIGVSRQTLYNIYELDEIPTQYLHTFKNEFDFDVQNLDIISNNMDIYKTETNGDNKIKDCAIALAAKEETIAALHAVIAAKDETIAILKEKSKQ